MAEPLPMIMKTKQKFQNTHTEKKSENIVVSALGFTKKL